MLVQPYQLAKGNISLNTYPTFSETHLAKLGQAECRQSCKAKVSVAESASKRVRQQRAACFNDEGIHNFSSVLSIRRELSTRMLIKRFTHK